MDEAQEEGGKGYAIQGGGQVSGCNTIADKLFWVANKMSNYASSLSGNSHSM